MMPRRTALTSIALLSVAQSLAPALPAQLPLGHIAAGNFAWPTVYPGLGGLFFIDPSTSTVTPVTNLPCELTGACTNPASPWTGSDYALNLPATGQLLMNGPSWVGHSVDAYVLTLSGVNVTGVAQYPLATYTTNSGYGNPAAALLPDGRVLLAIDPTSMAAPGPLAGALLGILDPTLPPTAPGAVTVVPVSPLPNGMTNALAVDADRGVAYLLIGDKVWSVPIPGGGAPTQVVQLPSFVTSLAVEPDGKLLAGGYFAGAARLWRVDPSTGTYTTFPQAFGTIAEINALHIDPVSGGLFLAMSNNSVGRLSPRTFTGTLSTVASVPAGGWGHISGLDMNSSLRTYGAPSSNGALVRWQLAPNPGGAPAVGNATFSLTNAANPGFPFSIWVLGLAPTNVLLPTTPSIQLHVAPITTIATLNGTPAQPSTLTFGIPADPTLRGMSIFFQCAHLDGSSISASSGLQVTIE